MLDTDTASFIIKNEYLAVRNSTRHIGEWCISSIVYKELLTGLLLAKSTKHEVPWAEFLKRVKVIPFTQTDAQVAAEVAMSLRSRGHNIGGLDEQIAGHALNAGLTLVTSNRKHFENIPSLRIESWN